MAPIVDHAAYTGRRADERRSCPKCRHGSYIRTRKSGRYGELVVLHHCHFCRAGLDEISAVSGIPRWRLLDWNDPLDELGPLVERHGSSWGGKPKEPQEPPSEGDIGGWVAHFWTMPNARCARRELARRGLSEATLRRAEIGYGDSFWPSCPRAFKFPVRDERKQLVGYKERFWPKLWLPAGARKERKSRTLAGDGQSWLYPLWALADDPPGLVVCEGEPDALLLNQQGLPAVTSTAGTTRKPDWNRWLRGRRVAVLYDAGSLELAQRRAAEFRSAGAREAWAVAWPRYFAEGEDAGDWFVKYRQSADELRQLIRTERRRS